MGSQVFMVIARSSWLYVVSDPLGQSDMNREYRQWQRWVWRLLQVCKETVDERPEWWKEQSWNNDTGHPLNPHAFKFYEGRDFSIRIPILQYPLWIFFFLHWGTKDYTLLFLFIQLEHLSNLHIYMSKVTVVAHLISIIYTSCIWRLFWARHRISYCFVGQQMGKFGRRVDLRASRSWSRTCHIWAPALLSK